MNSPSAPPSSSSRPAFSFSLPALAGSLIGFALPIVVGIALATSPAVAGGNGARRAPKLTPREQAKVELGRRLFFDPRASRFGERACATCHDPEHGFSDRARLSMDDLSMTKRHSQTLVDAADSPSANWDGEFRDAAELVMDRVGGPSGKKGTGFGGTGEALPGHDASPVAQPKPKSSGDSSGGAGSGGSGGDSSAQPPEPPPEAPPPSDPSARAPSESGSAATPAPPEDGGATSEAPKPKEGQAPSAPSAPGAKDDPAAGGPSEDPAKPSAKRTGPGATGGEDPDRVGSAALVFESPQVEADHLPRVDALLEAAGRYREAFEAAFGSPGITTARVSEAIASYCRSIRSSDGAYDRFVAGDANALSESAKRGLALFEGRAGCAQCHPSGGERAAFSDYAFHDTGISWTAAGLGAVPRGWKEAQAAADAGAQGTTTRPKDRRAFKTPTLRDVARRGPFMHDGSFRSLAEVVRYYAKGGSPDPLQDPRVKAFAASDEDVRDLVAFLRTLSGDVRPGLCEEAWALRAKETRLKFVDGDGAPISGLEVTLVPAGDVVPGDPAATFKRIVRKTDAEGGIAFEPAARTHVRIFLPDGLRAAWTAGEWVPDTCRFAVVTVPVSGRANVYVTFPKGEAAPAWLLAEHAGTIVHANHLAPRTYLKRAEVLPLADGPSVAHYVAAIRTDVPPDVGLRFPGRPYAKRITLDGIEPVKLTLR